MKIQNQILFIIVAIGFLHNTKTCAENIGSDCWSAIITYTNSDPATIYSLQNTSKQIREYVHYFLSNKIVPLITVTSFFNASLSINQDRIAVQNHPFF